MRPGGGRLQGRGPRPSTRPPASAGSFPFSRSCLSFYPSFWKVLSRRRRTRGHLSSPDLCEVNGSLKIIAGCIQSPGGFVLAKSPRNRPSPGHPPWQKGGGRASPNGSMEAPEGADRSPAGPSLCSKRFAEQTRPLQHRPHRHRHPPLPRSPRPLDRPSRRTRRRRGNRNRNNPRKDKSSGFPLGRARRNRAEREPGRYRKAAAVGFNPTPDLTPPGFH